MISLQNNTAARTAIAVVAGAVILGGVAFSKRKMTAMDAPAPAAPGPEPAEVRS